MTITNGYTTLLTIRTALGIPSTDVTNDPYIEATIESVSRMIEDHTGRKFYAATCTNYYAPVSIDEIYVDDLLSITTLKTDADGDGVFETTWATTDYLLYPLNSTPKTRIETSGYGKYSFPLGVKRAVQIVGSFGYSAISSAPKPIREACEIQSIRLYKRRDAPFGIIAGGEMAQSMTIPDLDPDVKMLLSPYVRRV